MKPAKSILDGPFVAFDHYDSFGVDFNPWPLYEEWMPTQWPAQNYRSKVTPEVGILNSSFKYTPSTHTDVRETWKRHGWKPKE